MRASRSLCRAGGAVFLTGLLTDFLAGFFAPFLAGAFLTGAFLDAFFAGFFADFLAAFRVRGPLIQVARFSMASRAPLPASSRSAVELTLER